MTQEPDQRLVDIVTNPDITNDEKRRRIRAMHIDLPGQLKLQQAALDQLNEKIGHSESRLEAMRNLVPWLESEQHRLEPNNCSRLHRLIEAQHANKEMSPEDALAPNLDLSMTKQGQRPHVIVVEHDWCAAFAGSGMASVGSDECKLPYPFTVFELRISGRNVVLVGNQMEDEDAPLFLAFVEADNGFWYAPYEWAEGVPAFDFAARQARFIRVALDAEVAVRNMVRAPHKLNMKRERAGKLPLFDFHIVRINRKPRANRAPGVPGEEYTHKRLHFRRGHWRHYETFKTWVRWALVGDPDLGFIDKEYRI